MKNLSPSSQKTLKTIHLIAAGTWLSCVVMLVSLPLLSRHMAGGGEVQMFNRIYYFIDMFILTPGAITTLVTGLGYSLFTNWGFVKHGWIIYKWIITLLIVLTGTFWLGPTVEKLLKIAEAQGLAALQDPSYRQGSMALLVSGCINCALQLVAVAVSVFKPWKNLRR